MKRFLPSLKKNAYEWTAFFLWGALTLVMVFFHEPWRDELQSCLLARDLSIPGLFEQMKYEGHFLLWYLILKPFLLAGLPAEFHSILSWLLAVPAVYLVLFHSRFDRLLKTAAVFSAPMLYWYSIFSRCYAPIPLLLALIASLYPERKKHFLLYGVLIALLANTHVYAEGLVLFLFLELLYSFFREWKNASPPQGNSRKEALPFLYSALLILAGVGFAFLTVIRSIFLSDFTSGVRFSFAQIFHTVLNFAYLLYPRSYFAAQGLPFSGQEMFYLVWIVLSIVVFLVLFRKEKLLAGSGAFLLLILPLAFLFPAKLHWMRATVYLFFVASIFFCRDRFLLAGVLLSLGWQFLFAVLVHSFVIPQRGLLFLLMVLFLYALRMENGSGKEEEEKEKRKLLFVRNYLLTCFFITLSGTLAVMAADLRFPYSGYSPCGDFLRKTVPKETTIHVWRAEDGSTLLSALLPNRFYALDARRVLSFHPHDFRNAVLEDPIKVLSELKEPAKVVILSVADKSEKEILESFTAGGHTYRKAYCSNENVMDSFERYGVYLLEEK